MKNDPAHHIAIAQLIIISGFMLFLMIFAFFVIDTGYTGRAVDSTAYILESIPEQCNVSVQAGYSIISIPCISTAENINLIFNGASVGAMYQYVPGDSDSWRVYNPNLPSYVYSDLEYVGRKVGYILIMNSSFTKSINGTKVPYTNIGLVQGWNLIGYPTNVTRNVSDAFSSINTSVTQVLMYNVSSGNFMVYNNPGGDLEQIIPEQGYWINISQNTVWVVS